VGLRRLTRGAASAAGALTLQLRLGQTHHSVGDVLRFLLIGVSRSIYHEFRLKPDWSFGEHRYPAEIMSEASCRGVIRTHFDTFSVRIEQLLDSMISNRALQLQE